MFKRVVMALTEADRLTIMAGAEARRAAALRDRAKPGNGIDPNIGLGPDLLGAAGEFAVAAYLALEWDPKPGIYDQADVGDHVEVRTAERADRRLIVQPWNKPRRPYVLVVKAPSRTLEIRCWCWGRDAQVERFYLDVGNGRPAFFVSQDDPIMHCPSMLTDSLAPEDG